MQLITEPPHIFGERWVGFQPTTYLYQPSIDLDLHHRPWLLTGATVRHRSAWSQWRCCTLHFTIPGQTRARPEASLKELFHLHRGTGWTHLIPPVAKFGTPWWALGPARYPWAAWGVGASTFQSSMLIIETFHSKPSSYWGILGYLHGYEPPSQKSLQLNQVADQYGISALQGKKAKGGSAVAGCSHQNRAKHGSVSKPCTPSEPQNSW